MTFTSQKNNGFSPDKISSKQAKDTGMAMVLICLLVGLLGNNNFFYRLAIPFLIINMIWPVFYKPVAKVWLGISLLLGTVVSKILLTIIFFVLVTPIGILRRICGYDSLQLKKWKKNSDSVFVIRNIRFEAKDIEKPY